MIERNKIETYIKIIKVTIRICWVSLLIFWAIKLFGGNWFEIVVQNENFVKFSNKVQNSWLKYIVSLITMSISNYFLFCAISQKLKLNLKEFIYFFLAVLSMLCVVHFVNIELVKMLYGYLPIILYGFIFQKGKLKFLGFVACILQSIFSIISAVVRNIEPTYISSYIISFILSIDVYIMYILYYLYSNIIKLKKEI